MVAVSANKDKFVEVSGSDLHSCLHIGSVFLCHYLGVKISVSFPCCLCDIFTGKTSAVMRIVPWCSSVRGSAWTGSTWPRFCTMPIPHGREFCLAVFPKSSLDWLASASNLEQVSFKGLGGLPPDRLQRSVAWGGGASAPSTSRAGYITSVGRLGGNYGIPPVDLHRSIDPLAIPGEDLLFCSQGTSRGRPVSCGTWSRAQAS